MAPALVWEARNLHGLLAFRDSLLGCGERLPFQIPPFIFVLLIENFSVRPFIFVILNKNCSLKQIVPLLCSERRARFQSIWARQSDTPGYFKLQR